MKTYCLFEGRHELPQNEGAICTSFDFTTNTVVKSELWNQALENMGPNPVKIYVTGLTPGITQFISEAICYQVKHYGEYLHGWIILLHYNSSTGEYWEQKI